MRTRVVAVLVFRSHKSYKLQSANLTVSELSVQFGFVFVGCRVSRQMRAEYFRLSEKGLPDADLLDKLRES